MMAAATWRRQTGIELSPRRRSACWAGEEDLMLSPVSKALARMRGGRSHGGSRLVDLSPLPCPACGARIAADHAGGVWGCRGGHRYPTTRALIAALIASGWRPTLEIQVGPAAHRGNARLSAALDRERAPAQLPKPC
jgi:hypothetical protein